MKLERFKVQDNKKKFIIAFTVCCVLLLAGVFLYTSFAVFTEEKQFNVINGRYQDPGDLYFAVYVDGQITNTFPSRSDGYTLDTTQSSCTNGVTVFWNDNTWSAEVDFSNYSAGNMSKTKCTMYFDKMPPVESQIIAQLDTTGACPTVNSVGTVNVTSSEGTNGYLCSAPDDYGTSYYFRGNVDNNYVYFAGFYWRILRLNGDGSIRIIYDGTSAHANGELSTDRQIGTSYYNSAKNVVHDNAGVGYMYGMSGTPTYEMTHSNMLSSTIKGVVDEWYRSNIAENEEHPEYVEYISDTLFCNDRSFSSTNTGTGTGTSATNYRPGNVPRTLYCSQQNDRFTVDDEVIGNGDLTYPVGLLTSDEGYLAGGSGSNSGYYLYTGTSYWTMSPDGYSGGDASTGGRAHIHYVGSNGRLYIYNNGVDTSYGVRPVLNLKYGSLKLGSGTASDPYRLSGN